MKLWRKLKLLRERKEVLSQEADNETQRRFRKDSPGYERLDEVELGIAYRELYRQIYKAKKQAYKKELKSFKEDMKKSKRGGR